MLRTDGSDGGAAFPDPTRAGGHCMDVGMSLRDWFAGQALMSLPHLCAHDTPLDGVTFEQHTARNAYALADAMLAARDECPAAAKEGWG